jgi:hypothetical protein
LKPAENSQDYSQELGTLLVAYLQEEQTLWKKKKNGMKKDKKVYFYVNDSDQTCQLRKLGFHNMQIYLLSLKNATRIVDANICIQTTSSLLPLMYTDICISNPSSFFRLNKEIFRLRNLSFLSQYV